MNLRSEQLECRCESRTDCDETVEPIQPRGLIVSVFLQKRDRHQRQSTYKSRKKQTTRLTNLHFQFAERRYFLIFARVQMFMLLWHMICPFAGMGRTVI